ncbi:MAG: DUF4386 family protein [Chloroflexaceae bacterium]|nr:DUF4386 family protein [Chloroflexaceae bacterium]
MRSNNRDLFGGISAILLGLSYIPVGIAASRNPALRASTPAEALQAVAENPKWTRIETMSFALGSLFGLATVQAVSRRVEPANEGVTHWASAVGMLAFALVSIKDFRSFVMAAETIRIHEQGDPVVQKTFAELMTPITDLDPLGFSYGGVGAWLTAVNLLAIRSGAWPKYLSYTGALGGLMYVAIMLGQMFRSKPLFLIGVMLGSFLGPAWYIQMGVHLLRGQPHAVSPLEPTLPLRGRDTDAAAGE